MKTELIPTTLNAPISRAPRSEGIHVSAVLRSIAAETGILKLDTAANLSLIEVGGNEAWWEQLTPVDRLRISIGLAWEEWYIPQLDGVIDHPGEMFVDGIYMTHDGESLDTVLSSGARVPRDMVVAGMAVRHVLCLHEVKATYKSTKTVGELLTQWLWLAQTKAYCKALNTLVAYLHVLFLCGDYKYPITPQLKVWRITYTQAEIDENWELITDYVKHRQLMEREADEGLEGGV